MARTFEAAIYTSLNLGTLGGNVTVTGFTQVLRGTNEPRHTLQTLFSTRSSADNSPFGSCPHILFFHPEIYPP